MLSTPAAAPPDSTHATPACPHITPRIGPGIVLAAALLILFLRRPDAFYRPQFWAEDFVFLTAAETRGAATFLEPQAGYLHLIPRSVALIATRLDPLLQPAFFTAAWTTVLVATVFSSVSKRLDLPLKPWLAAALLLVPHTGEVFFNTTNAQWIAAVGLLLTVLKDDPKRTLEWTSDLLFVIFSGLSGPFVIFTVPLWADRVWRRRSRESVLLTGVAAAAAATQFWFIAHAPPDPEFVGPFRPWGLIATISYRLFDNVFLGSLVPERAGPVVFVPVAVVLVLLIASAAARAAHRRQLAALTTFLVLLVATTTARKRFDLWGFNDMGDRYFFIPKLVLLWVTLVALATDRLAWRKRLLGVLLVCSVVTNLPRFRFQPYVDYHWYALCPSIREGKTVEVTETPDWKFVYQRGAPAGTRRLP